MSKNRLQDLNDHLFAQLERLGDEDKDQDQVSLEIERSKAITIIAKEIIANAKLQLDAELQRADIPDVNARLPSVFEKKQPLLGIK